MNQRNRSVDALDEQTIDQSPSIVVEATNKNRRFFAASDLASLSVDELWKFHGELEAILTAKIAAEVRELERRINRLHDANRRFGNSTRQVVPPRRPYPAVLPKYRNLSPPFETWSGRGKQPRWLSAQLHLGKRLEDFRIGST
jgi:DNA-binding protein H-NS